MNSEISAKVVSIVAASSRERVPPQELLRSIAGLLLQGIEGAASVGLQRGGDFDEFVGKDINSAKDALGKREPQLQVDQQEVKWSLEVLALHRLLQPVLPIGRDRVVAYTSGNVILGFGASPLSSLRDDVATLKRSADKEAKGENSNLK